MKEPIEVKDIREGDTIEATKGARCVRDVIERGSGPVFGTGLFLGNPALFGPSTLKSYVDSGYSLRILDRPKPPVILPTEPGTYRGTYSDGEPGSLYVLDAGGKWHDFSSIHATNAARTPVNYVPLTKLEPVAETARKMRDRLTAEQCYFNTDRYMHTVRKVAAEFGVTE